MLNEYEFQRTVKVLGLQDEDTELAEIVWLRCERAMQGKTSQQPVLLGEPKPVKSKVDFNQAQLQQLQAMVADIIEYQQVLKQEIKEDCNTIWDLCDKSKPESEMYFKDLNRHRDYLRIVKNNIVTLESIQKVIKKKLRTKDKGKL